MQNFRVLNIKMHILKFSSFPDQFLTYRIEKFPHNSRTLNGLYGIEKNFDSCRFTEVIPIFKNRIDVIPILDR